MKRPSLIPCYLVFLIAMSLFGPFLSKAEAGIARIELAEGSVLIGEIVSFSDGTYTVRLTSGDLVKFAERSVTDIKYNYAQGASSIGGAEVSPAPEAADLRFAGSNTIGETLVPELILSYVTARGEKDSHWQEGTAENERRLVVGDSAGVMSIPRGFYVSALGSSTAFAALREKKADVGMSSRPIRDTELLELAHLGDLQDVNSEHVIALDGLAVIVNSQNGIAALSTEQLAKIFACSMARHGLAPLSPGTS